MSLFRRQQPDLLEQCLAAIEASIAALSEAPEPTPVSLNVVEELPESAIPVAVGETIYKAARQAEEATAQQSAIFFRISALEEALKDPSLGLPRVRA
jgi:hypothetical protein